MIQAATKCLRFGFDRRQEGYGQNDEVLAAELGELLGIADSLPLRIELIAAARRNKLARAQFAKGEFGR